jgi:hypothetical protein
LTLTAATGATNALRDGSRENLVETLARYAASRSGFDYREVLMGLAPFFDCTRRLGLDPVSVFDDAARDIPADVAELARAFGRRADVTLGVFGWRFVEPPDTEPFYWFALRGDGSPPAPP